MGKIYQYIKVNPKVAKYLGVEQQRYKFADGNYLLWKFDLMSIGGNNDETIALIGGVGMDSRQARDEQKGVTVTPLPKALDARFIIDSEAAEVTEETNEKDE